MFVGLRLNHEPALPLDPCPMYKTIPNSYPRLYDIVTVHVFYTTFYRIVT